MDVGNSQYTHLSQVPCNDIVYKADKNQKRPNQLTESYKKFYKDQVNYKEQQDNSLLDQSIQENTNNQNWFQSNKSILNNTLLGNSIYDDDNRQQQFGLFDNNKKLLSHSSYYKNDINNVYEHNPFKKTNNNDQFKQIDTDSSEQNENEFPTYKDFNKNLKSSSNSNNSNNSNSNTDESSNDKSYQDNNQNKQEEQTPENNIFLQNQINNHNQPKNKIKHIESQQIQDNNSNSNKIAEINTLNLSNIPKTSFQNSNINSATTKGSMPNSFQQSLVKNQRPMLVVNESQDYQKNMISSKLTQASQIENSKIGQKAIVKDRKKRKANQKSQSIPINTQSLSNNFTQQSQNSFIKYNQTISKSSQIAKIAKINNKGQNIRLNSQNKNLNSVYAQKNMKPLKNESAMHNSQLQNKKQNKNTDKNLAKIDEEEDIEECDKDIANIQVARDMNNSKSNEISIGNGSARIAQQIQQSQQQQNGNFINNFSNINNVLKNGVNNINNRLVAQVSKNNSNTSISSNNNYNSSNNSITNDQSNSISSLHNMNNQVNYKKQQNYNQNSNNKPNQNPFDQQIKKNNLNKPFQSNAQQQKNYNNNNNNNNNQNQKQINQNQPINNQKFVQKRQENQTTLQDFNFSGGQQKQVNKPNILRVLITKKKEQPQQGDNKSEVLENVKAYKGIIKDIIYIDPLIIDKFKKDVKIILVEHNTFDKQLIEQNKEYNMEITFCIENDLTFGYITKIVD